MRGQKVTKKKTHRSLQLELLQSHWWAPPLPAPLGPAVPPACTKTLSLPGFLSPYPSSGPVPRLLGPRHLTWVTQKPFSSSTESVDPEWAHGWHWRGPGTLKSLLQSLPTLPCNILTSPPKSANCCHLTWNSLSQQSLDALPFWDLPLLSSQQALLVSTGATGDRTEGREQEPHDTTGLASTLGGHCLTFPAPCHVSEDPATLGNQWAEDEGYVLPIAKMRHRNDTRERGKQFQMKSLPSRASFGSL